MIRAIKNLLKRIHHSIPLKIRNLYMPLLSRWLYLIQNHINAIYPVVTLFEGFQPTSGNPLAFAYAGDLHMMQRYWDHMILGSDFKKRSLGRMFFGGIYSHMKTNFPNCGLLIMEQSPLTVPFLNQKPGFSLPIWVRMEIDISRPLLKLFNSRHRSRRSIRKNNLSYVTSKDINDFKNFYHNMYLPHITKRYGDSAGIESYESLLKIFDAGELILIKKDAQIIAGGMFELVHGQPFFKRLGVVDGNEEFFRSGAIGAIYYFLICELQSRGYQLVDIGGTRPLLSDGLTLFKISFDAQICKKNSQHSCVRLMILNDTPGTLSFLVHNPFLFKDQERNICRALFIDTNKEYSVKEFNKTLKASHCLGIHKTHLYLLGDKEILGHIKLPDDCVLLNLPSS